MSSRVSPITKQSRGAGSVPNKAFTRRLPSGRRVVLAVQDGREEVEVRSPLGELEVRITLTENGPVVALKGARLELESLDTVAVHCRRFEVQASEGTQLRSEGKVEIAGQQMRVQTQGDIRLDGERVLLNCDPDF